MKKNILPARTETKATKKLFGISEDQLKTVNGGGGVIVNSPAPTSSGSSTIG